jgi:hypothetical protein
MHERRFLLNSGQPARFFDERIVEVEGSSHMHKYASVSHTQQGTQSFPADSSRGGESGSEATTSPRRGRHQIISPVVAALRRGIFIQV